MVQVSNNLLSDTLNLIQLAREAAISRGGKEQAERLGPVADNLRGLVNASRDPANTSQAGAAQVAATAAVQAPQQATGILAQADFQNLLSAVSNRQESGVSSVDALSERNNIVRAMGASNMTDTDIARQLGMTREEVRTVMSLGKRE